MSAIVIYPTLFGVAIVIPAFSVSAESVKSRLGSGAVIADSESVPDLKVFRNAWRLDREGISVDLKAAKAIQRNRWRAARRPLLEMLDLRFLRAIEDGNTDAQTEITAQKEALRNVTLTDLAAVTTPEELASIWPEILEPDHYG